MALVLCLKTLHRHPREVNLPCRDLLDLRVYLEWMAEAADAGA